MSTMPRNVSLQKTYPLSFITAKYLAKLWSKAHAQESRLPQARAVALSLRANGKPISLTRRATLLSRTSSNFLNTNHKALANDTLRTLGATLIVKSTSTRSILCKILYHTPERMAFNLIFINCDLSRKLKDS